MAVTKFADEDREYLQGRKYFSAEYGSHHNFWGIVDQWPLYAGKYNIARSLAIYEILKAQMNVPGDIAEFGSWRGSNLLFMAKVLSILDNASTKVIHGFESFEGFPDQGVPGGVSGKHSDVPYKGNRMELEAVIDLYKMQDRIKIHAGNILNTLSDVLKDRSIWFSMVYLDVDVFEPTYEALSQCHDRLMPGGVFVLDEWGFPEWPEEAVAVETFLDEHSDAYIVESVPRTRQPSLILRKK